MSDEVTIRDAKMISYKELNSLVYRVYGWRGYDFRHCQESFFSISTSNVCYSFKITGVLSDCQDKEYCLMTDKKSERFRGDKEDCYWLGNNGVLNLLAKDGHIPKGVIIVEA